MKKLSMMMLALLVGVLSASARPATKGVIRMTQPDGSTVSLRLHGDEYRHWNTTDDGYSIVKNAEGYYVYARMENGQLAPTEIVAHDAADRTPEEVAYIEQTGRLVPEMTAAMRQWRENNVAAQARARGANHAQHYDYDKFRGLVILVEYSDCQFSLDNYQEIMDEMINQDNYEGNEFTNFQLYNQTITCVGSMRDYFRDNSNGIFVPSFNVVGPVQIDHSQYFDEEVSSDFEAMQILGNVMVSACQAADSLVNFKDYDTDNNGTVDMIYFIFSGLPSYIPGNNPDLLWPHQSDISYLNKRCDGVKLGRYACSTELFGYESTGWSVLEGIGTMCHEFSHVLGLPDFYDTDYEDQGQSVHPNDWSVMAGGEGHDYGRRPCGYSLFERYALGFAYPQVINEVGSYTLEPLHESNTGFRINTPQMKEYFILENRQKVKWDAKLPGEGMLVFRVDSTSSAVWKDNTINTNPNHNYYELLRARGYQGSDSPYDPFPGAGNVTQLDNETSPANLLTWRKKYSPIGLENIQEQDGVVTFDAFDANVLRYISIPEKITLNVGMSMILNVEHKPLNAPYEVVWTSDDESVATIGGNTDSGWVTAVSEGVAHVTLTANDSLTAVCTVTVTNYPVIDCIADMKQQEEGTKSLLRIDAHVLYVNGEDMYIRDGTGSIILSGMGLKFSKDDLLLGSIYGRYTLRDGMPVFEAVEGKTDASGVYTIISMEVEPYYLHISQLSERYYADMVKVQKVQLVNDGGVYAVLGDRRIRLYNPFKIKNVKVPTDLSKRYDVTAIFGTDRVNGELIEELYLLKSPEQVDYTELTGISLPETLELNVGRTKQLEPTLTPTDADVFLVWSSSDERVATVDQRSGWVKALDDGIAYITVTNLENGLSATCKVIVGDASYIKENIAEFKKLQEGTEAILQLKDAQVLFVSNEYAYVRDATGAICFDNTGLPLKADDILNGEIYGQYVLRAEPTLLSVEDFTNDNNYTVTEGEEVQPREVEVTNLTEADLADLVVLRNVEMTTVEGLPGIYVSDGSKHIRLYNDFKIKNILMPKDYEGKHYDLTGILRLNVIASDGVVTLLLALTKSPEEVGAPDGVMSVLRPDEGTVEIYTSDGRLLIQTKMSQLSQLQLKRGVYVVKTADRIVKMVMP